MLETVPIYWGAPNISEYFDVKGFIICKNFEEIKYAISKMSDEDYLSRIKWIKKNKKTASYHADFKKRAAQIIRQSLKQLNYLLFFSIFLHFATFILCSFKVLENTCPPEPSATK